MGRHSANPLSSAFSPICRPVFSINNGRTAAERPALCCGERHNGLRRGNWSVLWSVVQLNASISMRQAPESPCTQVDSGVASRSTGRLYIPIDRPYSPSPSLLHCLSSLPFLPTCLHPLYQQKQISTQCLSSNPLQSPKTNSVATESSAQMPVFVSLPSS